VIFPAEKLDVWRSHEALHFCCWSSHLTHETFHFWRFSHVRSPGGGLSQEASWEGQGHRSQGLERLKNLRKSLGNPGKMVKDMEKWWEMSRKKRMFVEWGDWLEFRGKSMRVCLNVVDFLPRKVVWMLGKWGRTMNLQALEDWKWESKWKIEIRSI